MGTVSFQCISRVREKLAEPDLPNTCTFVVFFVWVVSLLAGDRPMSPQFQKAHRPPLLPITDLFP